MNFSVFVPAGNAHFRQVVSGYACHHISTQSRAEKSSINLDLVNEITAWSRQNGGAGFVKLKQGLANHPVRWRTLTLAEAKDKCGHAIRKSALMFEAEHPEEAERLRSQAAAKGPAKTTLKAGDGPQSASGRGQSQPYDNDNECMSSPSSISKLSSSSPSFVLHEPRGSDRKSCKRKKGECAYKREGGGGSVKRRSSSGKAPKSPKKSSTMKDDITGSVPDRLKGVTTGVSEDSIHNILLGLKSTAASSKSTMVPTSEVFPGDLPKPAIGERKAILEEGDSKSTAQRSSPVLPVEFRDPQPRANPSSANTAREPESFQPRVKRLVSEIRQLRQIVGALESELLLVLKYRNLPLPTSASMAGDANVVSPSADHSMGCISNFDSQPLSSVLPMLRARMPEMTSSPTQLADIRSTSLGTSTMASNIATEQSLLEQMIRAEQYLLFGGSEAMFPTPSSNGLQLS